MPSEITSPSTTGSVDRLALSTQAVRGANANIPTLFCVCNCAEFEATPSIPGTCCPPYMCAASE